MFVCIEHRVNDIMSLLIHTHMINGWKGTRLRSAQANPKRPFCRRKISVSSGWEMRLSRPWSGLILYWITTRKFESRKCLLLSGKSWQQESLFYTLSDPSLCLLTVPFTLCPDWEAKSKALLLQSATRFSAAFGMQGFEVHKTIHATQETQHNVKGISITKKSRNRKWGEIRIQRKSLWLEYCKRTHETVRTKVWCEEKEGSVDRDWVKFPGFVVIYNKMLMGFWKRQGFLPSPLKQNKNIYQTKWTKHKIQPRVINGLDN